MKTGIFITATDTGVGKTYVGTGIVRELRSSGIDVGVMKPAETGCRARMGTLIPSDALKLQKAAGVRDSLALINPYRYRKPLAPFVAAALEGRTIDPQRVLNAYRILSERHEWMIVEGAGGIMVPLSQDYLFLDLAEALRLPVLVIARPGLGTINHTLLTIAALRSRKLSIAGVIINEPVLRPRGLAEKTSGRIIEKISGVAVLGTVSHGESVLKLVKTAFGQAL